MEYNEDMKAFIFDPLWSTLITPELESRLADSGIETIITETVCPLQDCSELFSGTEERLLCINPDYVGWKLTATDYGTIPNLKAILPASTSYAWIDTVIANEKKIPIVNVRNFSTDAVAEWAVMMLLNLARQVPRLIKDEFPLDYADDFMKYRGVQLKGKSVGIIGMGNIGRAIAERLDSLGLDVSYWSQSSRNNRYNYKDIEDLIAGSDIILPTFAHTPETDQLLSDDLLARIKPSAMIIDCIELANREKIIELVSSGLLFGYGFEAPPATFKSYPGNIWAAPAYAWATDQSMYNMLSLWIKNMIDVSNGEFHNRVN